MFIIRNGANRKLIRGLLQSEKFTVSSQLLTFPSDVFSDSTLDLDDYQATIRNYSARAGQKFHRISCSIPFTISVDSGEAILLNSTDVYCFNLSAQVEIVTAQSTRTITLIQDASYNQIQQTAFSPALYKTGSINRHIYDNFVSMINAAGAWSEGKIYPYTLYTDNVTGANIVPGTNPIPTSGRITPDYTSAKNTSLFIGGYDFSFIRLGGRPAALIGPRLALITAHVASEQPGSTVFFQRPDNSFQTVTIQSRASVPNLDLVVYYFSQAVTGINPVKVLPANYGDYFPSFGNIHYIVPSVRFSAQFNKFIMQPIYRDPDVNGAQDFGIKTSSVGSAPGDARQFGAGINSNFYDWERAVILFGRLYDLNGSESGSLSFFPINGELVLIGNQQTTRAYPFVSSHIAAIESTMSTLAGSAQQLIKINLASFNNYA